ncbi:MAG: hypothetical protein Q8L48_04760 [Archangium sp.]|nr:hypothetical protein [Archangium sp.]
MRRLALILVPFVASCTALDSTTRVERGPLLRTFERPVLLEGGVTSDVRVDWPLLKLTVVGFDVCRAQQVEEYAEEKITERTSGAAGPALSTGIANTLASAVLLAVSFAVTSAADTNIIDGGGRYGPSTRQYVQGASLVTLGIGVPALIVGLIARARSGEDVEAQRAEQVISQKDARCNERPVTGPMTLVSAQGTAIPLQVVDGAIDVDGTKLTSVPESLRFAEREVELTEEAQVLFSAWAACAALEQDAAKTLDALSETGLLARAEKLRECRKVRGTSLDEAVKAADAELARRRETGSPAAWAPGTNVSTFEEAVSAYAPTLKLAANSKDNAVLDTPEAAEGRAVLLEGIVGEGLTENIGIIQVGDRQVFLFIPPKKSWGGNFPNGTRVEVVALISGRQTLGERSLPLLRAVWMRTAW